LHLDYDFLRPFGWNQRLDAALAVTPCAAGETVARVVGEERELYRLQVAADSEVWGELPGRWRHEAQTRLDLPATGDWVVCVPHPGGERATVVRLIPRHTCLYRKAIAQGSEQILAANVDTGFIVASCNAELNPRRIERYLVVIWNSGAVPVVLLTKADLCDDVQAAVSSIRATAGDDVTIIAVSSVDGTGIDELKALLPAASTNVLLGSSGVGKSTLMNLLLGEERLKTQDIRADDAKGRHTTSARYLLKIGTGALLIDTPGMRELGLLDHEDGIKEAFDDIEALALKCRFSNCEHATEADCAIKAALANGGLQAERLASYHKLQREIAFEKRKVDKKAAADEKQRIKKMSGHLQQRLKAKRF